MPTLHPSDLLSHYRLLEPIGQGGMGQVWLAEDTALPRRVVVKVLHPHLDGSPEAVQRLRPGPRVDPRKMKANTPSTRCPRRDKLHSSRTRSWRFLARGGWR